MIRLPADKDKAQEAMWRDYAGAEMNPDGKTLAWGSRKTKAKKDFAEQAARTAWKIVQDWIEVQMSMIQMHQAETLEVFMPYIWNGKETFFQRLKSSGYRTLLPEKAETAA